MCEGVNRERLLLADVGGQLGWSGNKTKNVFSGRTKLSGDDVLDILGNPNVPIPDFKRYRMLLRIQTSFAHAGGRRGMNGTIEQLCAAVYGQAIGDALGVPYEFHDRDAFTCTGIDRTRHA